MKENPEIHTTPHHAEPMEKALSFMKRVYGFHEFRLGQDDILESVLQDSDTLAIMPTGGGKSLCYQVPAFIRPGVIYLAWRWYGEEYLQGIITDDIRVEEIAR